VGFVTNIDLAKFEAEAGKAGLLLLIVAGPGSFVQVTQPLFRYQAPTPPGTEALSRLRALSERHCQSYFSSRRACEEKGRRPGP